MVREWLEMSAQAFNRIDPAGAPEQQLVNAAFPSFNFDTIDGVSYRIDVTQPARYDRDGKNFVMAAPDENREALVGYLASVRQFNPSADGNWSVLPVPGVKLRFVSGAGALAHLAANPKIALVKDHCDGSALFELAP